MKNDTPKTKSNKTDQKHQELENQLKRALADYQNLERRVTEERQLLGQLSAALLIEKFLPVLDNLESAQKHLNDQGLEIVLKQFKDILAYEGVEEIEAEGQEFNPHLHEAVGTEEGPSVGKIVNVMAKGYKLNDKVLRPAKVVVAQNPPAGEPAANNKSSQASEPNMVEDPYL